jgi:hypothetical protein
MADVDPEWVERTANRFHRLLRELEQGAILRTTFEPWEMELLLDVEQVPLKGARRWSALRQYRAAGVRRIEGGALPIKLSEFLAQREQARRQRNQVRNTRRP